MKKQPLYMQMYEDIKDQIVKGVYRYGEKIPSKRVLADRFGVSVITAEHALALLVDEGYIKNSLRCGFFAAYYPELNFSGTGTAADVRTRTHEGADSFESRLLDSRCVFPPSVYIKEVRRTLSELGDRLLEPSDVSGVYMLRAAISEYLARARSIYAAPERIIIGSGARSLYNLAILMIGQDKVYAIEKPSYAAIEQTYLMHRVRYVTAELGDDGIKTEALENLSADVLHVTPYFSFPSGISASAAKKQSYLDWAESGERLIIEDDFGSELYRFCKPAQTLCAFDPQRVVYINTFSKTVSPAIRVGYMIIPEVLADRAADCLGFASCPPPVLEQYVLAGLISGGSFERNLNRMRRNLRRQNDG